MRLVLLLIADNRSADPDIGGPFRHWILGCSERPATIYDQTIQPDADRLELCGESALASAFTALGVPVTPHAIADDIRAHGGEVGVQNGTDIDHLRPCAQRHGFDLVAIGWDQIPASIRHDGGTTCANSWGARWLTYLDAALHPALIESYEITGGPALTPGSGSLLVML